MWFRMDVGRRQNADPRWLLPLICRRGHITKAEIGAMRAHQRDVDRQRMFQQVLAIVEHPRLAPQPAGFFRWQLGGGKPVVQFGLPGWNLPVPQRFQGCDLLLGALQVAGLARLRDHELEKACPVRVTAETGW